MVEIPLRELRNHTSRVLRRVEAGEALTVTVDGRPVADLVPHTGRRRFVAWDEVARFIESREPDPTFEGDMGRLLPDTTDEL